MNSAERERAERARFNASLVAAGLLVMASAGLWFVKLPYTVARPGLSENVNGLSDTGRPIIKVPTDKDHPATGRVDLVAVNIKGGPGYPVYLGDFVSGLLRNDVRVRPVAETYPPDRTGDDVKSENRKDMLSSQQKAAIAGMRQAGIPLSERMQVAKVMWQNGFQEGDIIEKVADQKVATVTDIRNVLQGRPSGQPVAVAVLRNGTPTTVDVTPKIEQDAPRLGVAVEPKVDLPFQVEFDAGSVGGPSAGLAFALAITERLTPGELIKDHIAATGTIDTDGTVGPVGGVDLKLIAAQRAGAKWFFVPKRNCSDVLGHTPDGLNVVAVETLTQTVKALEAINSGATQGPELPQCSAA